MRNLRPIDAVGSAGYTLAEMALCIAILGILMSSFMAGSTKFFEAHRKEESQRRIDLVANVLSEYAQTHYRLPCPADSSAPPELAGRENCPAKGAGMLPWRELAIPRYLAADAWGRAIAYNPASSLTVDSSKVASAVVDNACRSAAWYDGAGNHLNRAKALFCCGGTPVNVEPAPDMVALATAANAVEPAAGGSVADRGSYSVPHYMEGAAAPLPDIQVVTLSAGGMVLSLSSGQLFAHAGSGSCAAPQAGFSRPYACMPQNFHSGGVGSVTDKDTGKTIAVPPLYGVDLALTADKYQLRGALTNNSAASSLDDSLGFYVIKGDGSITDAQIPVPSTKGWAAGDTVYFTAPADRDAIGIGFFIVPDGYGRMDGYKHVDLQRLRFVSGAFGKFDAPASVADQVPPVLVSVDPATGAQVTVRGAEDVGAYHLYSNLNPGRANRTLRADSICRTGSEKVGPNGDFWCRRPTALSEVGVSPAHPALARIGFEDSGRVDCYESRDGHCRGATASGTDLIPDGEGGYVARVGDNSYDDVAFTVAMTACPQK